MSIGTTRVLLVDDHGIVRAGMRRLIEAQPRMEVIEASSGEEALNLAKTSRPDVVLLDLNMPGLSGFEVLRRLLQHNRDLRIVVCTMHADTLHAARSLRLGARGYVSKSSAVDELLTAIRRVCDGGRYVEREIAQELSLWNPDTEDPLQRLSTRHLEILRLLGEGKSMTEIAGLLGIAYKTVANSCTQIKSKLGLERTADLIRLSIDRGVS
jgi:DNA-binding NarL/FixJ family response regulator